jgi:hypothetical protein
MKETAKEINCREANFLSYEDRRASAYVCMYVPRKNKKKHV